ncbi:clan AA aspartic protease [Candidatus Poribacteria bacterium]|nr:clan AA aspartic protease [Candidatus Poribacteria bacterium]
MIHGRVNASQEIIISVQVRRRNEQTANIESALDTGFTGFLTLPPELVSALQLPFWETSEFTLGDGSSVAFNVHVATVLWDGQKRDVFVLAAEGGPLVGMSLLEGFRLAVDVVENGAVTIEAL